MKKILAIALSICLVVGLLVGCGIQKSNDGKNFTVVYLTHSTSSAFWSQVETGMLQAKKDLEAELGPKAGKHGEERLKAQSEPEKTDNDEQRS